MRLAAFLAGFIGTLLFVLVVARWETEPAPPPAPNVVEDECTVLQEPEVTGNAKVTAYTKNCKGCSGVTKDGTVADHRKSIVAADTRYYPMGTRIEFLIPGKGSRVYTVRDTGGDIKGPNRFDILVGSGSEARNWGVRNIEFKVLQQPKTE